MRGLPWSRFTGSRKPERIECLPILFAGLLNAWGTKGPAEMPAKRAYVFRDVMREARRLGLDFQRPPSHPFNPLAALRLIQVIEGGDQQLKLARDVFAAAWRDGADISDESQLRTLLTGAGMDADAILAASTPPENKARLRDATQAAVELGVFGVPTFRRAPLAGAGLAVLDGAAQLRDLPHAHVCRVRRRGGLQKRGCRCPLGHAVVRTDCAAVLAVRHRRRALLLGALRPRAAAIPAQARTPPNG